jgi:hypothetical protein
MGFARGAQMQQQQLHQAHDGRFTLEGKAGGVKTRIRDVWKHNLAQEMAVLRSLVEKYPYISMVSSWINCTVLWHKWSLLTFAGHGVPWYCRTPNRSVHE